MEKKKIKIEIKNRWTGKVLFKYEKEDNTIKETVVEAVKNGAFLRGADLGGADLGDAFLRGADLGDADLGGAFLRGAYLRGADLRGAFLRGANLGGADLGDANLGGAYLRGADLGDAFLRGANLGGADLRGADLGGADLGDAFLRGADLRGADLGGADLGGADLRGAFLGDAFLRGADLRGADLGGADLGGAKNVPYIPMMCPSDGAFIGWKKVRENGVYLVKLEICEDSKRSSASRTKCRCDKAKVLQIIDIESGKEVQTITNMKFVNTEYNVGSMVYADKWDDNRWNECSHGIHFFINRQEAEEYNV